MGVLRGMIFKDQSTLFSGVAVGIAAHQKTHRKGSE